MRELDAEKPDSPDERLFLVAFDLDADGDWPPVDVERLWVSKTSVQYEVAVRGIPFFVDELALGDVVTVRADHDRRELVYEELVRESEHSTIRVIAMKDSNFRDVSSFLLEAGCACYFNDFKSCMAVDVPVDVDYSQIMARLVEMKSLGDVGIQEGAISDVHRKGCVAASAASSGLLEDQVMMCSLHLGAVYISIS